MQSKLPSRHLFSLSLMYMPPTEQVSTIDTSDFTPAQAQAPALPVARESRSGFGALLRRFSFMAALATPAALTAGCTGDDCVNVEKGPAECGVDPINCVDVNMNECEASTSGVPETGTGGETTTDTDSSGNPTTSGDATSTTTDMATGTTGTTDSTGVSGGPTSESESGVDLIPTMKSCELTPICVPEENIICADEDMTLIVNGDNFDNFEFYINGELVDKGFALDSQTIMVEFHSGDSGDTMDLLVVGICDNDNTVETATTIVPNQTWDGKWTGC